MAPRQTKPRVPGPKDKGKGNADPVEAGTEIEVHERAELGERELGVARALGIPIGVVDVTPPEDTMAAILEQIAEAGSIAEALAQGIAEGLRGYVGQVIVVDGFKYQPSDYDPEGWPYVVIRAADEDGQLRTLTTGAKTVVAQLALARKLHDAGTVQFPFKARVIEVDTEGPNGEPWKVYKLGPPEA